MRIVVNVMDYNRSDTEESTDETTDGEAQNQPKEQDDR